VRILIVPAGGISPVNKLSEKDTLIRCQQALRLWKLNKIDYLLVSGGVFNQVEIQSKPAVEIMRTWLVEHGVRPKNILVEGQALDTFENIKFSLQLINKLGMSNSEIFVISHYLHTLRFYISFKKGYRIKIKAYVLDYALGTWETIKEIFFVVYHAYDSIGVQYLARHNRQRRKNKF